MKSFLMKIILVVAAVALQAAPHAAERVDAQQYGTVAAEAGSTMGGDIGGVAGSAQQSGVRQDRLAARRDSYYGCAWVPKAQTSSYEGCTWIPQRY